MNDKCLHFGSCGGCSAQGLSVEEYRAWKESLIIKALREGNINAEIEPMVSCPLHSRRRIELSAVKVKGIVNLGFKVYHKNEIIDIVECHVGIPQILHRMDIIRKIAVLVDQNDEFRINLLWTETGLDVTLKGVKSIGEKTRRALIDTAIEGGLARLNLANETLIEIVKPVIKFGTVYVSVSPGGFVQAVEYAEKEISKIALKHLKSCKFVADLFSGSGSFTFPALVNAKVHAFEFDKQAINAMQTAYKKQNKGLKELRVTPRDLFNLPVTAKELSLYDGLIFDPPRAGAEAQAHEIAKSNIRKVVAISCNVNSLIVDLNILQNAGYIIEKIIPIDQFLWSEHCELVALLSRKNKKTGCKL